MTEIKLKAAKRSLPTPALNQLRAKGQIPAELYGPGQKNQHLLFKQTELEKVYHLAGESSLINLIIEENPPLKVMIHEVERDPLTDKIKHLDLYQVRMDRELTVAVPLVLVGEAKAVKELGGTLVASLKQVEIACLPDHLISRIEVEVSGLETFDQVIRVADLKVPATIKVLTAAETAVASVVPPKIEAEPKPAETEAEGAAEAKEGHIEPEGAEDQPKKDRGKAEAEAETGKKEESKL